MSSPGGEVAPAGREGDATPKRPMRPQKQSTTREDDMPEPFSPEFFAQVSQGPMEQRYEKRMRDPTTWKEIPWPLVILGVFVGTVFAVVNVYAALTLGIIVGVSWYLLFFLGAMLGWKPTTINYVGGASTGASQIVIPIAFIVPALFLLTMEVDFLGVGGFYELAAIPSPFALIGFFLIGGVLGLLIFQTYRHLWIVQKPLPYPGGFHAPAQLLRMADDRIEGRSRRVRESVFVVTVSGLISAFWVALRDIQAFGPAGARTGFLDQLFRGRLFEEGIIPAPWATRGLYNGFLYLDPFLMAIGWFLRAKVALILLAGALVTFILPFFDPAAYTPLPESGPGSGLAATWGQTARLVGAAAILGAGTVALVRLGPFIRDGAKAIFQQNDPASQGIRKPTSTLVWIIVGAIVLAVPLLWLGGLPITGVLLVVPISVLLVGLLGFIAVKITGETAIQALSPMMVIGFLFLILTLNFVGFSPGAAVLLVIGATAFFGAGVIMSTDVFLVTKIGHYIGNPPHRQAMTTAAGLIPGVIMGTLLVWILADTVASQMAAGAPAAFTMPFARLFSGLAGLVLGEQIPWLLLGVAFLLGASTEYGTRLGTVFAIGMVLPLFLPVTVLVGALLREGYEKAVNPPEDSQQAVLARVVGPTGVIVGAALATLAVFVLNHWLL